MLFDIPTSRRNELIDITRRVREVVGSSGLAEGAALVFCPHTTAGVTINENADPDVAVDLIDGLARLAPPEARWRHSEGNSDGHVKSTLVGPSLLVPVEQGRLVLGTWQGIYLCEFDGPRTRHVSVTLIAGA